jgi:tripartite-type tricarboxylate transporter receptor subunit TctC
MRRLPRIAALFACLSACLFATGAAAEYPDRPIHLIVPQAAGSATDTLARIFAASFGDALGQQIVVDDRPGGALTVGMDLTAKAAPDGYTLCMSPIGALALTSNMVEHVPYDVTKDFTPIGLVTRGSLLLAVPPSSPFHSVKELIDYAKANPGKLSNASSSNGSPGHVDAELFKSMTGTTIVHVPYKGGAAAINDLIAGRVDLMFESLNSIAPFARSGQVRGLAVTGERRSAAFPDVPTIGETVPGFAAPSWTGVVGPAGLPQPIVEKLNAALNKAVKSDAFKARIAEIGDDIVGGTPQEFGALIASEYKKWGEVIRKAGIKID